MSQIGYWTNLVSAFRGGKSPQPRAELTPFYFPFVSGGNVRPQPKLTMNHAKLRVFSESPIPRRAIDYIKNQVSMLEWDVLTKDGKELNSRQKKDAARVKAILETPNSQESWRTFIEQIAEDMLVIGYSSIEKRDWSANKERPLVLYPFDSASLQMYSDWDGTPSKPRFAQVDGYGQMINFRDDQLIYVRNNPRTNTPWGLSPLEVAAQTIDYLLSAQAYAGRSAGNATARKLVDLGEDIDPAQLEEIRMWWRSEVEGRGHTPIIGGSKGAKSIELGATNDEGLFLKWQGFLINQVANAFGLDSQKFGAVLASRATGDILDDSTDEGAIRPLAHSIAAAINRGVIEALGIKDLKFVFRWTANYKDRKSLAAIHQIYITQDVLTIDETRAELGLPPLPEKKGQYTVAEYRAIYGVMNQGMGTPSGVLKDMSEDGMTPTTGLQPQKGEGEESAPEDGKNPGHNTPKLETRDEKATNKTSNPLKAD
ncbi:phage portal protein [Paenibacillus hexagrammi]|uniref:Phage portal protein n=1 Tax=Paenibacillus hexagrammi TaxID=2908839 RepID=A0ABY3SSY8_9BACL|nr:phage portal protein [Paenibacillus sp. YPD9-1]UJF36538.1 phage portal protein [Paenibacillus sp. YPD9-1]